MKKISCFLIAIVIGITVAFGAVACSPTSAPFPEKPGFYNLYEAYTNGWLTKDDLMSIAYYHNGGRGGNKDIMPENYTPKPKTPEVLSEEMDLAIRQTFLDEHFIESDPCEITLDNLRAEYYGTYSNCVAVKIWCDVFGYGAAIVRERIGGVLFGYSNTNTLQIWIGAN